jgi:hypothetical protein
MAIIETIKNENVEPIARIYRIGMNIIHNALVARVKDQQAGKPVTTREASEIANILLGFDKLIRLNQGMATDIVEINRPMSLKEIREAFLQDPFFEIKDVPRGTDIEGETNGRQASVADSGGTGKGDAGTGPIPLTSGSLGGGGEQPNDPFGGTGNNNAPTGSGTGSPV